MLTERIRKDAMGAGIETVRACFERLDWSRIPEVRKTHPWRSSCCVLKDQFSETFVSFDSTGWMVAIVELWHHTRDAMPAASLDERFHTAMHAPLP